MPITLVPNVYVHGDPDTDFGRMLVRPEYADALFVFNDNEQQFLAFQSGDHDLGGRPGGGNGAIRPYQCASPPRAAGIPTGPGYLALDERNRSLIDQAAAYVARVAHEVGYRRVIYSASEADADLIGRSIFDVGDDVRRHVVQALKTALANVGAADATPDAAPPTPRST